MFGWRYFKVQPTMYVMQYRKGKLIRQGAGLSFFYFSPLTSLIVIPLTSTEVPFSFEGMTSDYQQVTIKGQLTYRIEDPIKLSQLMNFSLTPDTKNYQSKDPADLPQRVVNHAHVFAHAALQTMSLKEVLARTEDFTDRLHRQLENAKAIGSLGVYVMDLSIHRIVPTPQTAKALEAYTKEKILQKADEAVYARKNAAIDLERTLKENRLAVELALQHKRLQIKETHIDTMKILAQKRQELKEVQLSIQMTLEEKRQSLLSVIARNTKIEADAKAYGLSTLMKALAVSDPRVIQSLACTGMDAGKLVAMAFKELAAGTEKINHFNISSDILRELMPDNGSQ